MISLNPKQADAIPDWTDPALRELCYPGGARAGKTWFICFEIIQRALWSPNSRHLIARYRFNHMVTTVWMQTLLPLLKILAPNAYKIDEQYKIITLWNGASIWGAGLDEKERVEKIMGSEYVTIFLNESTQISYDTYQKLKTRLSQNCEIINPKTHENHGHLPRKLVIDCNPRNQMHWIYRRFYLGMDPITREAIAPDTKKAIKLRTWIPEDNRTLADDYIEDLKGLVGVERQRLYAGEWVNQEGLVYPNFMEAVIDPVPIKKNFRHIWAVDFGYVNPFAVLFFAIDPMEEFIYCFDEYYVTEKTVHEHCKALRKYPKPGVIIADHDAEDRATMGAEGFPTIPANKDVEAGIGAVKDLMAHPRGLRIFSSCVNLIEELSIYSWEAPKEGKAAKEAPVKVHDHAADSCRYAAMYFKQERSTPSLSLGGVKTAW